jgi:DNA-binding CsgD family transcriptional regulator
VATTSTRLAKDYKVETDQQSDLLIHLVDNELKLTLTLQDLNGMHGSVSFGELMTGKLQSLLDRVSNSFLSRREIEILENAALGRSNKEIGKIVGLSESTIKGRLLKIFEKMHANDRTHAVTIALLNGWLDINKISEGLKETASQRVTEEETNEDRLELKDRIINILNKKIW